MFGQYLPKKPAGPHPRLAARSRSARPASSTTRARRPSRPCAKRASTPSSSTPTSPRSRPARDGRQGLLPPGRPRLRRAGHREGGGRRDHLSFGGQTALNCGVELDDRGHAREVRRARARHAHRDHARHRGPPALQAAPRRDRREDRAARRPATAPTRCAPRCGDRPAGDPPRRPTRSAARARASARPRRSSRPALLRAFAAAPRRCWWRSRSAGGRRSSTRSSATARQLHHRLQHGERRPDRASTRASRSWWPRRRRSTTTSTTCSARSRSRRSGTSASSASATSSTPSTPSATTTGSSRSTRGSRARRRSRRRPRATRSPTSPRRSPSATRLPDLPNSITRRTSAFFEPALDYIVCKFPRWDLQKFRGSTPHRQRDEVGGRGDGHRPHLPRGAPEGPAHARHRRDGLDPDAFEFDDLAQGAQEPDAAAHLRRRPRLRRGHERRRGPRPHAASTGGSSTRSPRSWRCTRAETAEGGGARRRPARGQALGFSDKGSAR
jgi:hypothetical protein